MLYQAKPDALTNILYSLGISINKFCRDKEFSINPRTWRSVCAGTAGARAVEKVSEAIEALERKRAAEQRAAGMQVHVYRGAKHRNPSRYALYPSGVRRSAEYIENLPDGEEFWADIGSVPPFYSPLPVSYWQLFCRNRKVWGAPAFGEPLAVFLDPLDWSRRQIDDRELYVIELQRYTDVAACIKHMQNFCAHDRVRKFWAARDYVYESPSGWYAQRNPEDVIDEIRAS
jgi:hypothetical protein